MLKKIRQALLQKAENPHPGFEGKPLYPNQDEPLDITFAKEFTDLGGKFVYCEGEIDLIEQLIVLVEKVSVSKIYVWEKQLQDLLEPYGFPIRKSLQGLQEIEASITTCEALVARTGSVLLSNAYESGRRLSIYAPLHIVIAKTSQLVSEMGDGLAIIQERYGEAMPTMISAISGPSRTADIEKRLVLGAHGPKELYLFLIEDRF